MRSDAGIASSEDEDSSAQSQVKKQKHGVAAAGRGGGAPQACGSRPAVPSGGRRGAEAAVLEDGSLVSALRVSKGLTLLALGRVEWINPLFHTERFIFPIGYRRGHTHAHSCIRAYACAQGSGNPSHTPIRSHAHKLQGTPPIHTPICSHACIASPTHPTP
eukprot:18259-Chlamydomonas_euryale.AAC.2